VLSPVIETAIKEMEHMNSAGSIIGELRSVLQGFGEFAENTSDESLQKLQDTAENVVKAVDKSPVLKEIYTDMKGNPKSEKGKGDEGREKGTVAKDNK